MCSRVATSAVAAECCSMTNFPLHWEADKAAHCQRGDLLKRLIYFKPSHIIVYTASRRPRILDRAGVFLWTTFFFLFTWPNHQCGIRTAWARASCMYKPGDSIPQQHGAHDWEAKALAKPIHVQWSCLISGEMIICCYWPTLRPSVDIFNDNEPIYIQISSSNNSTRN